jgi:hypothetical protein
MQVLGLGREAHVAHHRAVLLRKAGEVEHGAALALEMGGHADQGADCDHAGAADAGHQDAVGLVERPHGRHGQRGEGIVLHQLELRPLGLGRRAAMHRNE